MQRVGPDTVVEQSARVISVAFNDAEPDPDVFFADVFFADVFLDVDGERVGTRRLGPFRDCDAAVDAVVLTASLVIDPLIGAARSPSPSRTQEPAVEPPPTPWSRLPADEVVGSRRSVAPLLMGAGVGVGVASGIGPGVGPTVLGRLRVDLDVVPFVFAVGGRVDLPAVIDIDGAHRLESLAAAFFIDGCYRRILAGDVLIDGCVVAQAGVLRASAVGFDTPTPVTARVMGAGLALQVRVPVWSGLGLFSRIAVDVPLVGARLVDARGAALWQSPRVAGLWVVGIDGLGYAGGSG